MNNVDFARFEPHPIICASSVRYEDPGAVEGLAGALDSRLQVTGVVCTLKYHTWH